MHHAAPFPFPGLAALVRRRRDAAPLPSRGFVIRVRRSRVQSRPGADPAAADRAFTFGRYDCFLDGRRLTGSRLSGASLEPGGPGDNSAEGRARQSRIAPGTYPLGTHGWDGSKYHSFDYAMDGPRFPGLYVRDTGTREAILIHSGTGLRDTRGCIMLTDRIPRAHAPIRPGASFAHTATLIETMRRLLPGFPTETNRLIPDAWLVIEGEP